VVAVADALDLAQRALLGEAPSRSGIARLRAFSGAARMSTRTVASRQKQQSG
jgi:hypothetical protein